MSGATSGPLCGRRVGRSPCMCVLSVGHSGSCKCLHVVNARRRDFRRDEPGRPDRVVAVVGASLFVVLMTVIGVVLAMEAVT